MVVTSDVARDRSLCYDLGGGGTYIGRIDGEITEVGWDNRFIIAKQSKAGKIHLFILVRKGQSTGGS